ncbi:NUT family member 2B [Camelus dromedarius]|uniref:NUT family member 2B n=1 Tax=Camelus dromedarius TaxID=9838 RepID=A0A5N4DJG7_CAMDR|nr:NUT family member 2B [Camelus dromedarius]
MEELVGPVPSATGELDAEFQEDKNELKQEKNTTYTDPDLLSYTDKLCSQEDFVTKQPQLDLLVLAEDLEQEEGLTREEYSHCPPPSYQLVQK